MKNIKYTICCIWLLTGICCQHTAYAQDTQYEEHSLRFIVKPMAANKNISKLFEVDSIISPWIQNVRQSFPYSQDEMLKRVYYLDFSCPRKQIEEHMDKLPWIEEIMPIEKPNEDMLYTPTDYFWKVTKTSDPKYLWHLTKIEAEKAWDITKGDPNVRIAVIDNGFDATHPDLIDKIIYDYDPYEPNKKFRPGGCIGNGHGTTVASFVAASTDDPESSLAQLAAIGFDCKIVGYHKDACLEKIHHAAFVEKVGVITTSHGWYGSINSMIEDKLIREVLDQGIIIVAPAGNGLNSDAHNYDPVLKRDVPFYPFHPSYDNRVIIVSSTDINDNHTYYNQKEGKDGTHSHFPEVTVCAPGYAMMGATPTGTDNEGQPIWPYYGNCSGTSFATPIVAGLCGLMKSVFPRLTPAKAKQILETTTDPIKDAHLYLGQLGTGRINAYKAVSAVKRYADTCQASYTNQTISGQNINRNVCILNMSNTTIKSNASVTFKVDTEAYLGAGFSVEKGSEFTILPE